MKNKRNTYILLTVVLFIWAAVIYQFFSYSTPDEIEANVSNNFSIKPLKMPERDTLSIKVNYRDPFIGKLYLPQSTNSVKRTTLKQSTKLETPIDWPQIVYKGIVSDTKDKTKIFMVIINGESFLMKKGDIENEIFLKEGNRESIYVKYKGNLNIILLQE